MTDPTDTNVLFRPSRSLMILLVTAAASCAGAQHPPADAAVAARQESLHRAGVAAPLTLFPVRLLGRADANAADVLGLVLERHGMGELQVAPQPFAAGDLEWQLVPAAFGAHVRATAGGAAKGHALYAEFLGDPQKGPTEVRFVVVDGAGEVVLTDRQTPADAAFRRTAGRDPDPLGCAALVADRLFELADWRRVPGGVPDGKFAARWQQKSGAPDAKERAAMAERLAGLRAGLRAATFAVLPLAGDTGDERTRRFAGELRAQLGCQDVLVAAGEPLTIAPSNNQQRRLWDLAAAQRAAIGRQPVDADYVVATDLGVAPDGRGFVNVVVATRAGEVVVADFQNDQHALFQRLAPKTLADCDQLAAARLRELLR